LGGLDKGKAARAGLNIAAGAIPFVGGVLAAISASWSERDQEAAHSLLRQWVQMLEDELREKGKTIAELMSRLDLQDEKIRKRIESTEYQMLLKKSFRKWSAIDSESKREKIRNILSNAAASSLVSDDVVSLFIDWIERYSDFHFEVVAKIYNQEGISRGGIWDAMGKAAVREDSAEADLFRLLIDDLSQGRVVRQARRTDAHGRFLKEPPRNVPKGQGSSTMTSAFDREKRYVLTDLGNQFVHYAMNELAPRLTFDDAPG